MFKNGHIYYIYCSYLSAPHEKISVCICAETPLFFWINTEPAFHGQGQVLVSVTMLPGILKHDSYADLSRVKTFAEKDLKRARHCGPISEDLRKLLLSALASGNETLPEAKRKLAAKGLTPPAASNPPTGG